jgi:hypothetical protein
MYKLFLDLYVIIMYKLFLDLYAIICIYWNTIALACLILLSSILMLCCDGHLILKENGGNQLPEVTGVL